MNYLLPCLCACLLVVGGCKSHHAVVSEPAPLRVVHDTVWMPTLPADTLTFNLPCQVVNIHPELSGKALLVLWLHGGVRDQKIHSYNTHRNHWDNCAADDSIIGYLRSHNLKAVALLPMCHKADLDHCIYWRDCYADVKQMIDQLVHRGLVDPWRIYVAGSSDGGDRKSVV